MRKDERETLKKLIYFSPAIGLVVGLIDFLLDYFWQFSFGFKEPETLATIIAGFSFTMLGFLAAIAAFMFSLQKYKYFRRWVVEGGADIFFTLYKVSIVCLFFTFSCSVIVFTIVGQSLFFKLMLMSAFNNIIQTSLLALMITEKLSKAKESEESN